MLLKNNDTIVKVNVLTSEGHFKLTTLKVVKAPYWIAEKKGFDDLANKCCENIARSKARIEYKELYKDIAFSTEIIRSTRLGWNAKY